MDALTLLDHWYREAQALLPPGATVLDAHTHTGDADPDGFTMTASVLVEGLIEADHEAAVVCSSANPAGYPEQNDRILAECEDSGGRLIPFLRVDPRTADAVAEVRRSLDLGHRGIKLHPRSESFSFDHPRVDEILDVAAERRAPVLVHAGRAMPPLGRGVADHLDRRPTLTIILAHCAISDLGWAAPAARTRPGLVFDTAWWSPADLGALFAWVDASQILYASDTPYGSPPRSATLAIRSAVQAGLSGAALTAVFGGNLSAVLSDTPRERRGVGVEFRLDALLHRVTANLYGAAMALFRDLDPVQPVELALRACESSGTPYDDVLAAVTETLDVALASSADRRTRLHCILAALSGASTPAVAVPQLGQSASPGPRPR